MGQAGDEAESDRIARCREDNRNVRGGCFRRQCCRRTGGGNDRYLSPDQIGRELGQAFIVVFCPAIFDDNILTLDKAHLVQARRNSRRNFV